MKKMFLVFLFIVLFLSGCSGNIIAENRKEEETHIDSQQTVMSQTVPQVSMDTYLLFDGNQQSQVEYSLKKDILDCKLIMESQKKIDKVFNLMIIIDGKQEVLKLNGSNKLVEIFNIKDSPEIPFSIDFTKMSDGLHTMQVYIVENNTINNKPPLNITLFYKIFKGNSNRVTLGEGMKIEYDNLIPISEIKANILVNETKENIESGKSKSNCILDKKCNEIIELPIYYQKGYNGVNKARIYVFINGEQVKVNDSDYAYMDVDMSNNNYFAKVKFSTPGLVGKYDIDVVISEEMQLDSVDSTDPIDKFFISSTFSNRITLNAG